MPHELQLVFAYSGNGPRLYEYFCSCEAWSWQAAEFNQIVGNLCPHQFDKFFDYKSFFNARKYPEMNLGELLTELYTAIARSRGKDIFVEQTPWYGQRLDIMIDLFPEAKFIHMIRDGRDVALSFARTPWWHDSPVENLNRWQYEVNKIAQDASRLLGDGQYVEVRYEDFVIDPVVHVTRVLDFLGVAFETEMLLPENLVDYSAYQKPNMSEHTSSEFNKWCAKKENAVFSDNVFGWKRSAPESFSDIADQTRATLKRFGYEA